MSRSLISLFLFLAFLPGCAVQPPEQVAPEVALQTATPSTVEQWLHLQQEVAGMEKAEVLKRLAEVDKSAGTQQLFYYGILNQQLQTYGAWTVARDSFQLLEVNEELTKEQRQLVGILRQNNQNRINAYARRRELLDQNTLLQQHLTQAEDEKRQLQQKIQALTDLERKISSRKEE